MNLRSKDTPSVAAAKASISTASAYRIESDAVTETERSHAPTGSAFDPPDAERPHLRAVTIFEELLRRHPKLPRSVRRTLERRVRRWRAVHEQEVIFAQSYPPGHMGLSDFTDGTDLGVIVAGEPLAHLLYHFRLPYSGFEAVVMGGESFIALSAGLQQALSIRRLHRQPLGGVPQPCDRPSATKSCAAITRCARRATT